MRDVVDKAFAAMDEATRNHIADMLDTAAYGGRLAEREACARLVQEMKMQEILLACGELSAQESRTVRALLPWLANRIRNRA